jgi:hypothetical protein
LNGEVVVRRRAFIPSLKVKAFANEKTDKMLKTRRR